MGIAVRKVATPLRELTCHMGSHSVTCHPAEVTFPPSVISTAQPGTGDVPVFAPAKLVFDSVSPEGRKDEKT